MSSRPKKEPTTPHNRERRAYVRVPTRVRLDLSSGEKTILGWMENLSMGGLFIACLESFPEDTECFAEFTLKDSAGEHELKIRGWIAHVEENGMGMQFDKLDSKTRSLLQVTINGILYSHDDDNAA